MTNERHEIPRHENPIHITLREYDKFAIVQADGSAIERQHKPDKQGPLNLVFLTSIRDVGGEDRNGTMVEINGKSEYMMGLIEAVNQAINEQLWNLDRFIRIRGIITDDIGRQKSIKTPGYQKIITDISQIQQATYPATPTPGRPWIYPLDAVNDENKLLTSITHNIPSDFRLIPSNEKELRSEKQKQWEEKIFNVAQEMGADIIVSDHLMIRIKHLIDDTRFGLGRVLNIHPAISDPKNPNRLPGSTPTKDAITRAESGCVFDKKSGLYLPAIRDKKTGELVSSTGNRYATGASLHVLDKYLDNGPVIADSEDTVVRPTDTKQELRWRNYRTKIAVFARGMAHFSRKFYPDVGKLNFKTGENELERRTVLFR